MPLETLSPVVHLAQFRQMSPPGMLGNVYSDNGGYKHSPLGGGVNRDLVDMAGDPVTDDLALLAMAAAAATPQTAEVVSLGPLVNEGGTDGTGLGGGGGGEGDGGGDGGGGDGGAGAGAGD